MTWFDVDGARRYLAQIDGAGLPPRKTVYRLVAQGLRVARAEEQPGRKRGGSRMFFCPEWIDEFLLERAVQRSAPAGKAEALQKDTSDDNRESTSTAAH